jgi:RNA polymerase sigma-70 factor, ECF subfamily
MDRHSCTPPAALPSAAPLRKRSASRGETVELARAALLRYQHGDTKAFDAVHRLLAPRIQRLCLLLAGPNDAEDLAQEVFFKIHRSCLTYSPHGSVLAWACAIARRTHFDRVRQRRRRPETVAASARLESSAPGADHPEDALHARALASWIDRELGRLSESLREAYRLVKLQGLSCAAAGELLHVSPDAVKQRVHRASELMQSALQTRRRSEL